MKKAGLAEPAVFGLFQKRIAGDDSLLELASLRFRQAGMGPEMYAGSIEELECLMRFRPFPDAAAVVHLPREFKLTESEAQRQIMEIASHFGGRVHGLVVHDDAELALNTKAWIRSAHDLDSRLLGIHQGPVLFIEYAAGLEPEVFAGFFEAIRDLERVSACLDSGHIGIRQVRAIFLKTHPNLDVCALKTKPAQLPPLMDDLERATGSGLEAVLRLVETVGRCGKPVHFHLHDGHPLSTASPFGVSDHLSFLSEIPLPFDHHGNRTAALMFGPGGLRKIVARALETVGKEQLSFTLEIHPTFERLALGDAAPLFSHWTDRTNAEKMNHWLSVLRDNRRCVGEDLASFQQELSRP